MDANKDEGDDYDTTRTPEVINLDKVKANDEQNKKPARFDQFDVSTKQGFKELMRFQMRIFDQNYDFDQD